MFEIHWLTVAVGVGLGVAVNCLISSLIKWRQDCKSADSAAGRREP